MIITTGEYKKHGIAWEFRSYEFQEYLRSKYFLHPHNSRRNSLINREDLETINEKISRILVFQAKPYGFIITQKTLESAFEDIPRLLRAFPDTKRFTVRG